MSGDMHLVSLMQFCCHCHCGCPELFLAPDAPEEKRVVMTDDFGQQIQISVAQLRTLLDRVKSGAVEKALLAAG